MNRIKRKVYLPDICLCDCFFLQNWLENFPGTKTNPGTNARHQRAEKYCFSGRSQENSDLVSVSVAEEPEMLIGRHLQQVERTETITLRGFWKDLGLEAYKVEITKEFNLFSGGVYKKSWRKLANKIKWFDVVGLLTLLVREKSGV